MKLLPRVALVDDDPRRCEVVSLVIRGAFGDAPLTVAGDGVALAGRLHDTAVGLETAEQAAWLRDLRCPHGQGFWFARPVDADHAETLLRTGLAS